jgi:hypothetical protein
MSRSFPKYRSRVGIETVWSLESGVWSAKNKRKRRRTERPDGGGQMTDGSGKTFETVESGESRVESANKDSLDTRGRMTEDRLK